MEKTKQTKTKSEKMLASVPGVALVSALFAALIRVFILKSPDLTFENNMAIYFLPVAILILTAVYTFAIAFTHGKNLRIKSDTEFLKTKRLAPPVLSILAGILIVISNGILVYNVLNVNSGEKINILLLVTAIFGIVAGLYFITSAYFFKTGLKGFSNISYMAVLVPIWAILLLSATFMKLSTIANISEYYYDIVAYCFMMLFVFSYVKSCAAMGRAKTMFISGTFFALTAITAAVPRIFDWNFADMTGEFVAFSPLMGFALVALGLFAEEALVPVLDFSPLPEIDNIGNNDSESVIGEETPIIQELKDNEPKNDIEDVLGSAEKDLERNDDNI